jgi:hypothetical protein
LLLKPCVRSDENGDVRRAAVQELARGWKDDPDTLALLRDRVHSRLDGIAHYRFESLTALFCRKDDH